MENIYMAGGFGLYLNARTDLEGWDVELTFRRIGNRIARIRTSGLNVLLVGTAAFSFLALSPSAFAADPDLDPPGEVIEEILDHDDFKIHKRTERRPVTADVGNVAGSLDFLAVLGKVIFFLIVGGIVAWVCVLVYRNRHYFVVQSTPSDDDDDGPKTRTVLGMEVGADSLPRDIVNAARDAWQKGRKKEALSFLYRGSISWLIHSARAPVRESDTERDCLRHAREVSDAASKAPYFESLTREWVNVAYGNREPGDESMNKLLSEWPFPSNAAS